MSESLETVNVHLGERSYPIEIGQGTFGNAAQTVAHYCPTWHAIVLTDEHVEQPHAIAVAGNLADGGLEVDLIVVPAGEISKSVDTLACSGTNASLWEQTENRLSFALAAASSEIWGIPGGELCAWFAPGSSANDVARPSR